MCFKKLWRRRSQQPNNRASPFLSSTAGCQISNGNYIGCVAWTWVYVTILEIDLAKWSNTSFMMGMKHECKHFKMESPKWLVARIGRITSARIRNLVCQSRCTRLDQSLALLVLTYFSWKERISTTITATSLFWPTVLKLAQQSSWHQLPSWHKSRGKVLRQKSSKSWGIMIPSSMQTCNGGWLKCFTALDLTRPRSIQCKCEPTIKFHASNKKVIHRIETKRMTNALQHKTRLQIKKVLLCCSWLLFIKREYRINGDLSMLECLMFALSQRKFVLTSSMHVTWIQELWCHLYCGERIFSTSFRRANHSSLSNLLTCIIFWLPRGME